MSSMSGLFSGCSSLNSLEVSKWNTSKVTSMGSYSDGMFEGCSSLKSLDLSKCDTSNVVFMNYVFSGCTNLKVDCSKWNVAKVKEHKEFATNAPGVIAPSWAS